MQAWLNPFTVLSDTQTLTVKNGNFVATKAGASTITIPAPTAGTDDGTTIMLTAGSDYAHKFTCTGKIQRNDNATECNSVAVAAYTGASVCLRAYNGYWQTFFASGSIAYS